MKTKIYLLGILILAGFTSCRPYQPPGQGIKTSTDAPKIAFATFSAITMSDKSCSLSLIEYRLVDGTIKEKPSRLLRYPVEVTLLSPGNKKIRQFQIEHPLVTDQEFIDNLGQLQRKTILLDTARVYLRINQPQELESIRFSCQAPGIPAILSTLNIRK